MRDWLKNATASNRAARKRGSQRAAIRRLLIVEVLDSRLPLAVDAQLVKDINALPDSFGNIRQLVPVGSTLYFTASTNTAAGELWKSDGSAAGTVLVRDIKPGVESSYIQYLTNVGGTLYFRADDGLHGEELWKSDGTAAGTVLVKDIFPGNSSSTLYSLTDVNGTLFFSANDGISGQELWKSDGTAAGTIKVKDIWLGSTSAVQGEFTNVNGILYFRANDGANGTELWKSDGTYAGTVLVKDTLSGSSFPNGLTNVSGTLFFSANDGATGFELWKSDGTANGTTLVKNIAPNGSYPRFLTNVNGVLFFNADDGFHGSELWKSDGTSSGTVLVKDIRSSLSTVGPRELATVNGVLFFRANDGTNGYELWKSDGTIAGTVMVKDAWPGSVSGDATYLSNVNGTLFYWSSSDTTGEILWKSDGSSAGTVPVKDISSGALGSDTKFLVNLNGTLYFTPIDAAGEFSLWKSDGTSAGTEFVKDVRTGTASSVPTALTDVNGTLFFSAFDDINGFELWKSDGTSAGTALVKDIYAGSEWAWPKYLTNVSGTLFFQAKTSENGVELWKYDGTSAGTVLVKDIRAGSNSSGPQFLTNVNGMLYFSANDGTNGYQLWKSDGTTSGTAKVKDVVLPKYLTNVNGLLYFRANGNELWKSDGTTSGTALVIGGVYPRNLTNVNGTLYFKANTSTTGAELWKSDGTTTAIVKDIRVGTSGSDPQYLTNINGSLYFSANDGSNGFELWKSDGTSTGTIMVGNINAGVNSSFPKNLKSIGDNLYFQADDGINGSELWKSDGTTNGTGMVKNIMPGIRGSAPKFLTDFNGELYFSASIETQNQLWKSDGTASGTRPLSEFLSSQIIEPKQLLSRGAELYFTQNSDEYGSELWKLFETPNNAPTDILLSPNQIPENAGPNAVVGNFSTSDPNKGDTFTYALIAGAGDTNNVDFNIIDSTLSASINLNSAIKSSYSVRVRATDQGGLTVEKAFIVSVIPNGAPTDITLSASTIQENSGANAVVGSLITTDPDAVNSFTYSIVSGSGDTDNAAFTIDGATLRTVNNLDFENKASLTVRIRSTDQSGLFTEKAFPITVIDINESPTDIAISSTIISEGAGANATVGTLSSTDPDTGSIFTYALVPGVGSTDNVAFNISGSTLRATNNFDFESKSSYSIRVRSTDQGGQFVEKNFVITISNINEAPTNVALSTTTISENAGANATVGILTTTDPDTNDSFTYTLVAGTGSADNAFFNVSGSTLRATNSFDFEARSSYSIRLRSTDQGGLFRERSFTITVTNINETPTNLTLSPTIVSENSGSNVVVGSFSTSDPDVGSSFTYVLVAGTGDNDNAAFNLVGSALRANGSLDFESQSSYSIHVRSTDQGGLFIENTFIITVINVNEAPTDIALTPSTIAENAGSNATVGTLTTSDPDSNNTFTYSFVAGSGDTDNTAFNINGSTLRATGSLNFETKSSYSVRIRSTDQGGLFTEKAFTVTVADANETPIDISLSPATVVENAGADATVGTLTTTDPDSNNTFIYALVAGSGDADNTAFNISGSTLKATSNLNFETKSSYSVRIRSTDQGGLFTEKTFTVAVTNANETPVDISLSPATVAENAGDNATVGTLTTADPDSNNTFTYSLVAGSGDSDNAAFNISDSILRATNGFNFESKSSYTVRIRSTDQGGLFIDKEFTVTVTNVNESPIDINLSSNTIAENAGVNATVGTLSTADPDSSNSFTYTLVSGAGDSENGVFDISGSTVRATSSFNFETKSSYTVRVRATDQGGLFTEKAFTIAVTNINETPTDIALSQLLIAENADANTAVGTLSSSDPDSGSTFGYTLVSGLGDSDNAAFNINGASLRASSVFDFETRSSYSVRIRSTDQDGLFTEKSFLIQVSNVNESPVDIVLSQLSIAENAGANATVATLSTSDPDAASSFTYVMVPGAGDDDNSAFTVVGAALKALSGFDFETKSSYLVRIRSTDQGGLFTEKSFTISITNVNETPTDIALSQWLIAENSGENAALGTLTTSDPDSVNSFNYALVTGAGDTDNGAFNISGSILRASGNFDFETKSSYTIRVRSTDQGGLFTEKTFAIAVTNINETPTDILLSASLIAENMVVNSTLGNLSTTDPDIVSTFAYALVAGAGDADNAAFNIVGDALKVSNSFDFEARSSYTVRIRATDQGGLFTEKNFFINVTDLNETPVEIASSQLSLLENAGSNATIGLLSTQDPDASDAFSYSLVPGVGDVDNATFNIEGSVLRATSSLNFESRSSYSIRIRSTDRGGLFAERSFVVTVANVNEPPLDLKLSNSEVAENAGVNAVDGGLSTVDPDSDDDAFIYTLISGLGDADNGAFNIIGATLRAKSNFDFESKPNYTVRVRSTDQGGLSTEKVFTISVIDINEVPLSLQLSNSSVDEGLPVGTEVGSLSTTDPDAIDAFVYSLVAGIGSDDNSRFVVSGDKLKSTEVFDFQAKSSYSVRIRSTDKGNLSTENILRIDIRDTTKPTLVSVERSKAISNPTNGSELEFIVNFSEAVNNVTVTSFVVSSATTATINAVTQLTPSSYRVRVIGGDLDGFNGLVKIALSPNPSIKDLAGNVLQPTTPLIDEAFLVDHTAPEATVNELITKLVQPTISGTVSDSSATISITIAGRTYDAVNEGNGNWTFNGSGLVNALQAGRSDVAVFARDAAGNVGQDSTSQEILVILHAPTNLQFTAERVHDQMNSLTSDILFGRLSATDLDPVDQLSWRLSSGTGDQDNSSFFVSGNSIYLQRGHTLNYDTKSQYSVRIEALDLAGNATTAPVLLMLQKLPVANDDRFALVQGNQMVIDVKANDIAPDNNLQQLTIRLVSQNSSSVGTVEVTSDNRILLTANSNAYGILDVYYRLSDPRGGESRDAKIQMGVSRSSKQNPWFQLDVNDNGLITPSDALLIINVLNDQSSVRLVPDGLPNPAYLDVNGDKRITPSDALVVINYLNSRTASEGEFDLDYTDLVELDIKAKKTRARTN